MYTLYNGVSYIMYTYDLHHNFVRSLTAKKFVSTRELLLTSVELIFHNSNSGRILML